MKPNAKMKNTRQTRAMRAAAMDPMDCGSRGLHISLIDNNGIVKNQSDIEQRRKKLGLCPTCPNQLYTITKKSKFNPIPVHGWKVPINNEEVYNGRCLNCKPLSKIESIKRSKELLTVPEITQRQDRDGNASVGEHTSTKRSRSKQRRSSRAGLFSSGTFNDDLVEELKDDIEQHNIAAPRAAISARSLGFKNMKGNVIESFRNILMPKVEDIPISGIDAHGCVLSQEDIEKRRTALGLCVTCPNQLYVVKRCTFNPLKTSKITITNEDVLNGRCLDCNPIISKKKRMKRTANMRTANKKKPNRRRNESGHGSEDEAASGKRNRRKHSQTRRASLFSSGTFSDDLVGKLTEDIKINVSQSPGLNSEMKSNTDQMVMTDETKQVAGESSKKNLTCLEPSLKSIKKDVETKPSAEECHVPETSESSDELFDRATEAISEILTKPLELRAKIALCDYLIPLCRDHDDIVLGIVMGGGLMAIHKMMTEEHVMDNVLQEKALTLLKLILPICNYSLLKDIPIIEAITILMMYHPTCLKIQEMTVHCFIILCHEHDDFKTLIRESEAGELALSAMYNFRSDCLMKDVKELIEIL